MQVEYHWARYLSRADPNLPDVYTAELRVRRPDGDWLYLLHPTGEGLRRGPHARRRELFARHLGLGTGD